MQLTANEVVQAMQDDCFFSDHASSILLVPDEISSLVQQGSFTVVALAAQKRWACEIAAGSTAPVVKW